jgi:hypothetical protein
MKRARGDFDSILDMGLAMAGFTQGALLAAFFLAWLPRRPDGSGFLWSAPLSVAWVFALARHGEWVPAACRSFAVGLLVLWFVARVRPVWSAPELRFAVVLQTGWLALGLVGMLWANEHGFFEVRKSRLAPPEWTLQPLAWPWYVPAGSLIAFVFGLLLARPGRSSATGARADVAVESPCSASRPL